MVLKESLWMNRLCMKLIMEKPWQQALARKSQVCETKSGAIMNITVMIPILYPAREPTFSIKHKRIHYSCTRCPFDAGYDQ
jgi:hypothetical protein